MAKHGGCTRCGDDGQEVLRSVMTVHEGKRVSIALCDPCIASDPHAKVANADR